MSSEASASVPGDVEEPELQQQQEQQRYDEDVIGELSAQAAQISLQPRQQDETQNGEQQQQQQQQQQQVTATYFNEVQRFLLDVRTKYNYQLLKPSIWMLVCNADHTKRHPALRNSNGNGIELIEYLVKLIKIKYEIDPRRPFVLFISEFCKTFTTTLHDQLKVLYGGVDCFRTTAKYPYNAIFVFKNSAWVQDNLFGKDGVEENLVGKYMAVLLAHQLTKERLLCIFVHLSHVKKTEIEAAWTNLKNRLQEAKDDQTIKYVVVAGDFNAEPNKVRERLQLLPPAGEQLQLAIGDSDIKTNKSVNENWQTIISQSSIDNVVTLGPVTTNVTLMEAEESKLRHFPMYGWLQFSS